MANKTFGELVDDCRFVEIQHNVGGVVHVFNHVARDNFYLSASELATLRDMEPDDSRFPAWLKQLREFACPPPAKPAKGQ
jgi:hypothetical protein